MNRQELDSLVGRGEGLTLEFKRSTAKVKEAMQTLCAFQNSAGGVVLFGIRPDGMIEGQAISDQTLREVAQVGHSAESDLAGLRSRHW